MNKYYTRINWQNRPSTSTALGATNLNHMDVAINELDNRIVLLDAGKLELSVANQMVKSWTMNTTTGIITVTLLNGSVYTYDLDIEKIVVNFNIDDDNNLIITFEDGTQKTVNLDRFVYTFQSTATIAMSMSDRTVTANIVNGSVTMSMLDASIQTTLMQYMLDAQAAASDSELYASDSKRFAVGGVIEGDAEDNSRWYYQQASNYAQMAEDYSRIVFPSLYIDLVTGDLVEDPGQGIVMSIDSAGYLTSEVTA